MLKQGILNPELNYALSSLGHLDLLMVGDAGMPIPQSVERIDLAFVPGVPEILPVIKELVRTIVVERVYIAEEIQTESPDLYREYEKLFAGVAEVCYVPHQQLKEMTQGASCAVRTGEFVYHYSTVVLVAGCAY